MWAKQAASLALFALAGCTGLNMLEGGAPMQLPLLDGAVVAAGADGYCVDPRISRPRDGFAVLGSCRAIAGIGPEPFLTGVVTVQFGASGTAVVDDDPDGLVAFLKTGTGVALLSEASDATTVQVQSVRKVRGAVIVAFQDSSAGQVLGVQAQQWRSFSDLGGRLVTINLRGPKDAPLTSESGAVLIEQTVRSLQQANIARTGQKV